MAHPFAKAADQNFGPTLSDLLSDDDLRDLARHDHHRDRGELSPDHQRLLAMVLPELCGAILAQRAARRADPVPPRRTFVPVPDTPNTGLFDTDLCRRARARRLADHLAGEDLPARAALIRTMTLVNGGTLTEPRAGDTFDAQRAELSLLDVSASGDTLEECLAEWIKAARRAAPLAGAHSEDTTAYLERLQS